MSFFQRLNTYFEYINAMVTLTEEKKNLIDRWNRAVILLRLQATYPLVGYHRHVYIRDDKEKKQIEVSAPDVTQKPYIMSYNVVNMTEKTLNSIGVPSGK